MTEDRQLSILDFGLCDSFDCSKCAWIKAYGFCFPREHIGRQYLYESKGERHCSDYCTKFASNGKDIKRSGKQ